MLIGIIHDDFGSYDHTLFTRNLIQDRRAHIIGIAIIAVACFVNSIPADFAYDDWELVVNYTAVHGFNPENLKAAFTGSHDALEFLPLRDLTYMLDHTIFGLNPWGYHMSNVIYYLLCCLALYAFLARLFHDCLGLDRQAAFISAAVFAVSPVHVEVVAGISQRKDILLGIFVFLSLWSFSVFKSNGAKKYYWLSLAATLLAITSKGTAIVLPFLLLITDALYGNRGGDSYFRKLARFAPHAAVVAILTYVNIQILSEGLHFREALYRNWLMGTGIAARSYHAFLLKPLIPYPLSTWNPIEGMVMPKDPRNLAAYAGLLAFAAAFVYTWKRLPTLSYCLAFFTISVAPSLYYVQNNFQLPDRYLFVPSVAHSILAGFLLSRLLRARGSITRKAGISAFALILLVSAGLSINQNMFWRNDHLLLQNNIRQNPETPEVYAFLGKSYFLSKKYDEAFRVFGFAKNKFFIFPDYDLYSALYYYQMDDNKTALRILKDFSSRYNMGFVDEYCLYGRIYEYMGQNDKAIMYYKKALGSSVSIYAPVYSLSEAAESIRRLETN